MGADLFESYVGSIIGAMVLGAVAGGLAGYKAALIPLAVAAVGVVCSIIFTFFVNVKEGGNPQRALDGGTLGAAAVMVPATYFIAKAILGGETLAVGPESIVDGVKTAAAVGPMEILYATIGGLIAGIAVGFTTEHYCATDKGPVLSIRAASKTGPATNIIAGVGVGMVSTALPIVYIIIAILVSYNVAGLYGVALAALGMLSTTGIQLAVVYYCPVA